MPSGWRKVPFLRWSFWRLLFGMKRLTTQWQVGDGREARLAQYVLAQARRGDAPDVVRVIDEFGYRRSFLINVGDEKGALLDAAIASIGPRLVLELGTYCGYSALRMAIAAPQARIVSIEFNVENAAIARTILDHAGVADRVDVVVGSLGDRGATIAALESSYGFAAGAIDAVFIDHDKNAYLPDLQRILDRGWLHAGSVVVADNVKFPGAPEYHAYMDAEEGRLWRTVAHETHVEYQSVIRDLVLVSTYVGDAEVRETAPQGKA